MIARYLIEPENQTEIIFNENLEAKGRAVIARLQSLIGQYCLYRKDNQDVAAGADDADYTQEEYMQELIY